MKIEQINTTRGVVTLTWLDRVDWGATGLVAGYPKPESNFTKLNIHHTVMVLKDYDQDGYRYGDLDDIKRYMQALKISRPDLGLDVPYSFVVFNGGSEMSAVVCEGRGKGRTGAHTAGQNSTSYGVAYAANTEIETVSWGMEEAVRWVGRTMLVDPGGARETTGHWQSKATACQGKNGKAVQGRQQPPFDQGLGDDMATLDDIWDILTADLDPPKQNVGHSVQRMNGLIDGMVAALARIEAKVDALESGGGAAPGGRVTGTFEGNIT